MAAWIVTTVGVMSLLIWALLLTLFVLCSIKWQRWQCEWRSFSVYGVYSLLYFLCSIMVNNCHCYERCCVKMKVYWGWRSRSILKSWLQAFRQMRGLEISGSSYYVPLCLKKDFVADCEPYRYERDTAWGKGIFSFWIVVRTFLATS